MAYAFFSHNGEILPINQASVSLSRVEYAYGFGVYENVRVVRGQPLFMDDHGQRLINSARIIGLEHNFEADFVNDSARALIKHNQADACNIKIMLIGGANAEAASLEMLCLNPLFPDRKLYRNGVKVITYNYERPFPQAKTLNMLSSYLAYRQAQAAGSYDALFIDRSDSVREGSRTNFFGLKDRMIYSPPPHQILAGITRDHVLKVARQQKFKIVERPIGLNELDQFDCVFLTSTSTKIVPIKQINDRPQAMDLTNLSQLMKAFDKFLDTVPAKRAPLQDSSGL